LTARKGPKSPQIVVWSEGAVPVAANDLLAPGTWTAKAIHDALPPGATLLLGAYRAAGDPAHPRYYNSLIAARAEPGGLKITGVYDKFRLVPFGEYLPAEGVLQPLGFKDLTHIGDSFSFGPRPRAISPDGAPPVQPLICYESLFPGFTREGAIRSGVRPSWIVNVSNDAWFGVTSGPIQHLNQASYRAIEEGLPIVRATPTGVSAVIDAYGRPVPRARLDFGAIGIVDTPLPAALRNTTYSRFGDEPLLGLLMLAASTGLQRLWSLTRKTLSTFRRQ
jgi:apolipoprotein N-acyltransferase